MRIDPLTQIAQNLTTEFFGNSLKIGGYFLYSPDGKAHKGIGHPIKVVSGQFMSNGRLSNHWSWHSVKPNGSLDKDRANGYGGNDDYFKPITRRQAIELARKK